MNTKAYGSARRKRAVGRIRPNRTVAYRRWSGESLISDPITGFGDCLDHRWVAELGAQAADGDLGAGRL
jgi:hypothetical protein